MASPSADNRALLTVDHPQYEDHRMDSHLPERGLLLIRHDNLTWPDPNFQRVLRQGILWGAGDDRRLKEAGKWLVPFLLPL